MFDAHPTSYLPKYVDCDTPVLLAQLLLVASVPLPAAVKSSQRKTNGNVVQLFSQREGRVGSRLSHPHSLHEMLNMPSLSPVTSNHDAIVISWYARHESGDAQCPTETRTQFQSTFRSFACYAAGAAQPLIRALPQRAATRYAKAV